MGREARTGAGDDRVLKFLPASHQNVGEQPGTRLASSTAVQSYLNNSRAVLTGLVGKPPAAIVLP